VFTLEQRTINLAKKMKKENYVFLMNTNPSNRDLDDALKAIYELLMSGAVNYKYQCPVNYEELGAYAFDRILKMLKSDAVKAGVPEDRADWKEGLRLWMRDASWKTAPSYLRSMLSCGFIDYTRSFYSEFKHQPTDAQEKLYIFDRLVYDEDKVSVWDLQQAFALLSTKERKAIYARINRLRNKDAEGYEGFSAEFNHWFDAVSAPQVIVVEELYDLTMCQVEAIRNGRLAYRLKGVVWHNIEVVKDNNGFVLSVF
jgi:hypothetical protein